MQLAPEPTHTIGAVPLPAQCTQKVLHAASGWLQGVAAPGVTNEVALTLAQGWSSTQARPPLGVATSE